VKVLCHVATVVMMMVVTLATMISGSVVLLATLILTSRVVALSGMQLLHAWGTSIDDEELEETLVSMLKVARV
jgi:hypothetical protein